MEGVPDRMPAPLSPRPFGRESFLHRNVAPVARPATCNATGPQRTDTVASASVAVETWIPTTHAALPVAPRFGFEVPAGHGVGAVAPASGT